jgi:hypothetical protein
MDLNVTFPKIHKHKAIKEEAEMDTHNKPTLHQITGIILLY